MEKRGRVKSIKVVWGGRYGCQAILTIEYRVEGQQAAIPAVFYYVWTDPKDGTPEVVTNVLAKTISKHLRTDAIPTGMPLPEISPVILPWPVYSRMKKQLLAACKKFLIKESDEDPYVYIGPAMMDRKFLAAPTGGKDDGEVQEG